MIELKKLIKISDVLNSEGAILSLFKDPNDNFYFGSFLKDGSGTIYYSLNSSQLKDYLQSKITLGELYIQSQSFLVKHKFRKDVKTYLKEDFIDSLQCGADYYKDFPVSMKSKEIENKYGS